MKTGLAREEMPQFPKEHFHDLLAGLRQNGTSFRYGKTLASDLKPAQGELNPEKVSSMAQEMTSGDFNLKPLVVSSDGYILDGHHRWAAAQEVDPEAIVPVMTVGMGFADLLNFSADYSAPKKGFDEAEVPYRIPKRVNYKKYSVSTPKGAQAQYVLRYTDGRYIGSFRSMFQLLRGIGELEAQEKLKDTDKTQEQVERIVSRLVEVRAYNTIGYTVDGETVCWRCASKKFGQEFLSPYKEPRMSGRVKGITPSRSNDPLLRLICVECNRALGDAA